MHADADPMSTHDTSMAPAWRLFAPAVWLAAAAALAWSLTELSSGAAWGTIAVLVVLANLVDLMAIDLRAGMRVSSAHFAAPFAMIAVSPEAGVLVASLCIVSRALVPSRSLLPFDVAVNVAAAGGTVVIWSLVGLLDVGVSPSAAVFASAGLVAVFALIRAGITRTWAARTRAQGLPVPASSGKVGRLMVSAAVLFTPVFTLFAMGDRADPWTWLLLVFPFIAPQLLVRAFGREETALAAARAANLELEQAAVALTESLVTALDARDEYTAGHSLAVAVYARDIAAQLDLPDEDVERIYMAGLLHDIGKIAVPDAVLRKPGKLTDEEFAEIKKHPTVGEQILRPVRGFAHLIPGVRWHHERLDGRGYPDGLAGDDIPQDARIIAVADAYNAMTSKRSYRDAMKSSVAVDILREHAGSQHEAAYVEAFQQVLAREGEWYARAVGPQFKITEAVRKLMAAAPDELDDARTA